MEALWELLGCSREQHFPFSWNIGHQTNLKINKCTGNVEGVSSAISLKCEETGKFNIVSPNLVHDFSCQVNISLPSEKLLANLIYVRCFFCEEFRQNMKYYIIKNKIICIERKGRKKRRSDRLRGWEEEEEYYRWYIIPSSILRFFYYRSS